MVNMEELAKTLKGGRSSRGMSLESASEAAKISPAYLHKLEAGRVQTPSPHVLRRLAAALDVPYLKLMTLAGYLDRSRSATAADRTRADTRARKGKSVKHPVTSEVPTNAEIVRLLQAVRVELGEVRRGQEELATKLATLPQRTPGK
jgi:transcriptional regulator with XRE-family HTH domain